MEKYFIIYLTVISFAAVIVTCYDKWASKHKKKNRTPEASLLLMAALGGSVAMYIIMKIIRHKTKHSKFMVGIPVILIIQIISGILIYKFV